MLDSVRELLIDSKKSMTIDNFKLMARKMVSEQKLLIHKIILS
jgi:hypothetical protein